QDGAYGQGAADAGGHAAVRVLKDDGDRDGEPDDDGLEDQHDAAELPDALAFERDIETAHDSSAAVNEWREGWLAGASGGSSPPDGPSSLRASPAVMTDPVISTAPPPGPASATASSASVTAASIASSRRGADRTRSSPKISAASSAVSSGSNDRSEELRVTTSSSSIPATSLSPLAAKTPVTWSKLNDSSIPATVAAMPAGLCAASMTMVGLRLMTSSRPGDVTFANASRTRSTSSPAAP